jgi:hypothetical protein
MLDPDPDQMNADTQPCSYHQDVRTNEVFLGIFREGTYFFSLNFPSPHSILALKFTEAVEWGAELYLSDPDQNPTFQLVSDP